MNLKSFKKIFFVVFLVALFFNFNFEIEKKAIENNYSFATQAGLTTQPSGSNRIFLEDIPGMNDIAQQTNGNSDPTDLLAIYLEWLIKLSVIIGSILAVVYIIIGGLEYMTTDIFSKKSGAKERIENAIMGLIFLISGYLIFYTINPNILKLNFDYKMGDGANVTSPGGSQTTVIPDFTKKLDDIDFSGADPYDSGDAGDSGKGHTKDLKDSKKGKKELDKMMKNMGELEYAHFLAQVSHESGGFKIVDEHGYKPARACTVFGKKHPKVCTREAQG